MVRSIVSGVSPGCPTWKSPCTTRPSFLQCFMNSRACSMVAPFLMFFRICGSPDSNPTISNRQPASFMAFRVSYPAVTLELQDQVNFKGLNASQISIVRSLAQGNVSSSKEISFAWGKYSRQRFTSSTTLETLRVRQGWPLIVCGQRQNVHNAGQPREV